MHQVADDPNAWSIPPRPTVQVIREEILKTTTVWRGTSLAVIVCLGWSTVDVFLHDPAFRGRMIFFLLLAAAVLTGLGWLVSSQRDKASRQAEELLAARRRRTS